MIHNPACERKQLRGCRGCVAIGKCSQIAKKAKGVTNER
jgi:hypothetical protein